MKSIKDDGRVIEVDMKLGTPIFQGCWRGRIVPYEEYHQIDLFYARQQMMAILLGWADHVEF